MSFFYSISTWYFVNYFLELYEYLGMKTDNAFVKNYQKRLEKEEKEIKVENKKLIPLYRKRKKDPFNYEMEEVQNEPIENEHIKAATHPRANLTLSSGIITPLILEELTFSEISAFSDFSAIFDTVRVLVSPNENALLFSLYSS